jgi:hypothetical protein
VVPRLALPFSVFPGPISSKPIKAQCDVVLCNVSDIVGLEINSIDFLRIYATDGPRRFHHFV